MSIASRAPFAFAALAAASIMTFASAGPVAASPSPAAKAKRVQLAETHQVVRVIHGQSGPRRICLLRNGAPKGARPQCLAERQWIDRGMIVIPG